MYTDMKSDEIILGSTVKLNVHLEPMGDLHMEDYDFTCYVYTPCGNTVTIPKKEAIKVDEDNRRHYMFAIMMAVCVVILNILNGGLLYLIGCLVPFGMASLIKRNSTIFFMELALFVSLI